MTKITAKEIIEGKGSLSPLVITPGKLGNLKRDVSSLIEKRVQKEARRVIKEKTASVLRGVRIIKPEDIPTESARFGEVLEKVLKGASPEEAYWGESSVYQAYENSDSFKDVMFCKIDVDSIQSRKKQELVFRGAKMSRLRVRNEFMGILGKCADCTIEMNNFGGFLYGAERSNLVFRGRWVGEIDKEGKPLTYITGFEDSSLIFYQRNLYESFLKSIGNKTAWHDPFAGRFRNTEFIMVPEGSKERCLDKEYHFSEKEMGERINELIISKGVDLKTLANQCNMSDADILDLTGSTGSGGDQLKKIHRLCGALNTTPNYLMYGIDELRGLGMDYQI